MAGSAKTLYSVFFINTTTGWAAGLDATMLKTTNGGTNWAALSTGTTNSLGSVHFTSANEGWAVGIFGEILKTTDGGATWAYQPNGITGTNTDLHITLYNYESVFFIDTNTGWAVGNNGCIMKRTPG